MKRNFEVGDVSISKVLLEKLDGSSNPVDIRSQTAEIAIYEDINQPTVMIEMVLVDAVNLVEFFPIVGEERLTVVFNTPGLEERAKYVFNIFSVESSVMNPQTTSSVYVIKGVTPIHFVNAVTFIEKAYRDSIANIAEEIITDVIDSTPNFTKDVYVEPTKGVTPLIIPRSHPFEAVDMLRQRAISTTSKTGGRFIFFETQQRINFTSLENLINISIENQDKTFNRIYTYKPNSNIKRSSLNYGNILNFNYLTKFDSISKLVGGGLNTRLETFDIIQKNSSVFEFNYNKNKDLIPAMDSEYTVGNSSSFLSEFSSTSAVKLFNVKDASVGENYISNFMPVSTALATIFDQNKVRILIYGDSALKAGDVIQLKIPSAKGFTDTYKDDRYYSGSFIIIRLRHNITIEDGVRSKHMISMDCARIGVRNAI